MADSDTLKADAKAFITRMGLDIAFDTPLQRDAVVALMAAFACQVARDELAEVVGDWKHEPK